MTRLSKTGNLLCSAFLISQEGEKRNMAVTAIARVEYPSHLKPITPPLELKKLLKLKELMMEFTQDWMKQRGCMRLFLNEITGPTGSCEQRRNVFSVLESLEEKNRTSNLRQTAQLDMEVLLVQADLDRVWTSGRSFRKENDGDGRHKSEFELVEWEIRRRGLPKLIEYNIDYYEKLMALLLQDQVLLDTERRRRLDHWLETFKTRVAAGKGAIDYTEAIDFLQERGYPINWGQDLKQEHERALTAFYGMVLVQRFPEPIKFFNMRRSREPEHKGCVDAVDVLAPYAGECDGGSAREEDMAIMDERLQTSDMVNQIQEEYRTRGWDPDLVLEDFETEYLCHFRDLEPIIRAGSGRGMARVLQFVLASDVIIPY